MQAEAQVIYPPTITFTAYTDDQKGEYNVRKFAGTSMLLAARPAITIRTFW